MTSGGGRRVAWAGTRRKPVHGGSKCAIHGALRSQPRLPGTLQPRVRSGRLEELASAGCGGWCPSRHVPDPDPEVKARHAWMLLLSVLLQLRMARLCPVLMRRRRRRRRRRRGRAGQVRLGRGGSGQAKLSQAKPRQFKAIQGNSRQFKAGQGKASQRRHALALRLHTSHVSTGWRGWGGGTVMRHGWRISSPHGWVHGGSRDPTHAVPPRTNLKCRFCLGSSSS